MSKKIFVFSVICFAFLFLVTGLGYCASYGSLTTDEIMKSVGNKLVNVALTDCATESGNIFMLVRDGKKRTRDLQWVFYNPLTKKVVKSGDCPFKFENDIVAVSPNGKYAAAFSRYPTELWLLNIESGNWDKIMENPKVNEDGLTIIRKMKLGTVFGTSYLRFVDNSTIATCLQNLDKDKNMKDIVPTFVNVDKKEIEPFVSFSDMLLSASKVLESKDEKNCSIDDVFPESNNSILFSIKNEKHSYVMRIGEDKVAHIVHAFPTRYITFCDVSFGNIVCRISLGKDKSKDSITVIKKDGTLEILAKEKGIYGFALENDAFLVSSVRGELPLVELVDSKSNHFSVAKQEEVSLVYVDRKPSTVFFVNQYGIKWFNVVEKMKAKDVKVKDKTKKK